MTAPTLNRLAIWLGAACFFAAGYLLSIGGYSLGIWAIVAGYINVALAEHPLYEEGRS